MEWLSELGRFEWVFLLLVPLGWAIRELYLVRRAQREAKIDTEAAAPRGTPEHPPRG